MSRYILAPEELSPDDHSLIHQHLESCWSCRTEARLIEDARCDVDLWEHRLTAWCAGAQPLYLARSSRPDVPHQVSIDPARAFLPVVILYELLASQHLPTGRELEIRLLRLPLKESAWTQRAVASSMLDPATCSLMVRIPTSCLTHGSYLLQVVAAGNEAAPEHEARLEITATPSR
jgi:hypothetical protein